MKNVNKLWDKAETNFRDWLNNPGKAPHELPDSILRASFLMGRKNLRKSISGALDDAITFYNKSTTIAPAKEKPVPDIIREHKIEDMQIGFLSEPSEDLDKEAWKPNFKRIESPAQKNKRFVKALLEGEKWPLLELYETGLPGVETFIRGNNGTAENAKDIFQDGLVVLFEKLYHKQVELTAPIESYLFGICKKLWMNQLRKMKVNVPVADDLFGPDDGTDIPAIDDIAVDEKIFRIIESLGEPCWSLLEFYYYRNMDWKKIAVRLGYASAGSARNQKYKCLERIRKQVA